jgi:hypothetical protein
MLPLTFIPRLLTAYRRLLTAGSAICFNDYIV